VRTCSAAFCTRACSRADDGLSIWPPMRGWPAKCGVDLGVGQPGEHPIGLLEQRIDVGVRAAGCDPLRPHRRRAHLGSWSTSGLRIDPESGRFTLFAWPKSTTVAGVLLAAGAGTRYGMPKVLADDATGCAPA